MTFAVGRTGKVELPSVFSERPETAIASSAFGLKTRTCTLNVPEKAVFFPGFRIEMVGFCVRRVLSPSTPAVPVAVVTTGPTCAPGE